MKTAKLISRYGRPLRRAKVATLLSAVIFAGTLTPLQATADSNNRSHGIRHNYTDYADVVDVRPVYRQVQINTPQEHCWYEQPSHQTVYEGHRNSHDHNRNHSGIRGNGHRNNSGHRNPVLGGLIGGAIGNQIGRQSGSRQAQVGATIAGALIGSVIGNEASGRDRRDRRSQRDRRDRTHKNDRGRRHIEQRPIKRCETRTVSRTEERLDGYEVTYRYRGRNYHMRTQNHPGDRIPLNISVRPARQ